MARGVRGFGWEPVVRAGEVDVQTTTEWETRRMRVRTWWERVGGIGGPSFTEGWGWGWGCALGSLGGVMDQERGCECEWEEEEEEEEEEWRFVVIVVPWAMGVTELENEKCGVLVRESFFLMRLLKESELYPTG